MNGDLAYPERGHEAEIGRGEAPAGLERHLPRSQVLAGGSDIVSGAAGANPDRVLPERLHALLHEHRVRALGHDRPGHDAHALPRAHHALEGSARERRAQHLELARTRVRQIGAPQGVTVHRGIGMAGDGERRTDLTGEDPAERAT